MFKDFDKRLKVEIKRSVDERLRITEDLSKFRVKVSFNSFFYMVVQIDRKKFSN